MKNIYIFQSFLLLVAFLFGLNAQAQISTVPSQALDGSPVQIIFDATQGSGGLKGYTGDVYAHIGVLTDKSTSSSNWLYVKADWAVNKPECKMTRSSESGKSDVYTLSLTPSIREYFGVPAAEKIKQIAVVFRSSDGTKTGKATGDKDIFVDVYTSAVALKLSSPRDGATYTANSSIPITATANASNIQLFIDGISVFTSSNGTLNYNFTPSVAKTYSVKVVATEGANTETETISIGVIPQPVVEDLPQDAKLGLTVKDGKATFVLEAPGKNYVVLLGSFNDYKVDGAYVMKKTTDGKRFWITLDNLESNKDYSYQYLVDGSIKIADPYSSLILDPWNDKYITSETYPDMPTYPTDLTTGIASSFRLNPASYTWQVADFTPVAKEKLNIYEVLIRDFIAKHDYKTLTDTLKYFKNLGINAIELMPVNEFEGNSSWGYNPSFYFAPDKYYGPANDLKRFVDECHKQGIAVILDMVLNHSFGQSPLVQLYFNSSTNKVTSDNPWYNVDSPNTAYSWGYDFNHESSYTKAFVDSVNSYWMSEFKVDGYRFDFTKGFTQKTGDGWAYDASRIAILKRMNSKILEKNPKAIVIFEHLTDNTEERELSNAGILLWGNINNNSCEGAMGYTESSKSDLSWASYQNRGWSVPGVVAYMESHDEERIAYKQKRWGNALADYNIKDSTVAYQRDAALASVFMTIPGPKMIWQWGELGYNYSINTCEDGSVDDNGGCRTSPKPLFWNKNTPTASNASNLALKQAYSKVLTLRASNPAFSTNSYTIDLANSLKSVKLTGDDMNVIAVANLDMIDKTYETSVPESGYYYSETTKDSVQIVNGKISVDLNPGQYHILTSKRLFTPLKLTITSPLSTDVFKVEDVVNITATSVAPKMTLYINDEKINDYTGTISYSYPTVSGGKLRIRVVATDGVNTETKETVVTVNDVPIVYSITSPTQNATYTVGDVVNVDASANSKTIKLYIDNVEVASGTSVISYSYTTDKTGEIQLKFTAANTTVTKDTSITINVKSKMVVNAFGPNPLTSGSVLRCNLKPTVQDDILISVYSIVGKLVYKQTEKLAAGVETIVSIPTGSNGFDKGIFIVKVTGKSVNVSQKIVVL